MDLAGARLVASRHIAHVEMADPSDVLADGLDMISFHDLDVIDVEENLDVWARNLPHDLERLTRAARNLDHSSTAQQFCRSCVLDMNHFGFSTGIISTRR